MYLTKPEVTKVLQYQMVLIPYRVQGDRARLFDSSLTGVSHAFTLWAARSDPRGPDSSVFDFVGGGSLSLAKTAAVLTQAEYTMERLTGTIGLGKP